jgi:two-component system nitrogen regulation response regulator GlnG
MAMPRNDNGYPVQIKSGDRTGKRFQIPLNFRILIVDDDEDFREALSHRLTRKKIHVVAVESGEKALTIVEKNCFDLILLDLRMPGMDGVDTFRRIIQIRNDCVVIIMTAYFYDQRLKTAEEMNPFALLEKPFEFAQLASYIEKIHKEKNR